MDLDDDNDNFQSINKFPRTNHAHNGRSLLNQTMDEDKDKSDTGRTNGAGNLDLGRFYNWPSSRIVRVSRASGGKDRHSKVLTSKGPRDRRVRLSVNTAIQFYDLQDRLGYDQPSKAVEWLLKAAESSISELPPMPNPFPDTPKCEEKRPSCTTTGNGSSDQLALEDVDPVAGEVGDCGGNNNSSNYFLHEQNQQQVAKSCSSASTETSKGSGLSLSRSEIRVKARERAKERVLAEKEKESTCQLGSSLNPISQTMTSSFTELLSSGMNNHHNNNGSPNSGNNGNISESNFFLKSPRPWSTSTTTTPMDYFTSGLQMHISSNPTIASPMFSVNGPDNHNNGEPLQHFSFVPDHHHLVHAVNSSNNGSTTTHHDQHNNGSLNFTISSLSSPNTSLAGINRGTLQSNSSSSSMLLPSSLQLPQRFSNIDNGSPQSFFLAPMDCNSNSNSHYQFLSGYDAARLQLFYGDPNHHGNNSHSSSGRHSKGKGKN